VAVCRPAASRNRGDQHGGRLCFDYRLTAPLFDHQGMMVSAAREPGTMVTAVRDAAGRQTATGTLWNADHPYP
jgi:3-methylfumaryl-CoA hydratase